MNQFQPMKPPTIQESIKKTKGFISQLIANLAKLQAGGKFNPDIWHNIGGLMQALSDLEGQGSVAEQEPEIPTSEPPGTNMLGIHINSPVKWVWCRGAKVWVAISSRVSDCLPTVLVASGTTISEYLLSTIMDRSGIKDEND